MKMKEQNITTSTLGPTTNSGNLILPLLKLDISSNIHIDAVEYLPTFYQLAKAFLDGLDNISWVNLIFF